MKKVILKRTYIAVFIVSILILSFIKVNTNIYVGDYSYYPCSIDIQMKIDDMLVLNDSLHSFPYYPTILMGKLRYGLHKITVSSKKANINQVNRIFLLPNQHIYVEFLRADTFCLAEMVYFKESILSNDSTMNTIYSQLDSIDIIIRDQSSFIIKSSFNPFYTE